MGSLDAKDIELIGNLWEIIEKFAALCNDEIVRITAQAARMADDWTKYEAYNLTLLHDRLIELGVDQNHDFFKCMIKRIEVGRNDE